MKTLIVLIGVGLVAACVPVRGTNERWMSDAEIEAKDHGICAGFGAQKGSQPYMDCRLRLRSDRSAEDRTRRWSND